ncbi:MAG: SanA/YdcF family protein [Opitutales bacterium]|jgi:SanA protein
MDASGRTLSSTEQLPPRAVVVVLGLSEFHPEEGYAVLNFHPRLDAAAELAANGQVEDLVVSGLPEQADAMAAELMRRGVTQRITRDPYGWRTLDSVARARAAYPGRTLVFVSQGWHNDRAIWIARRMGVESYGYPAKNGPDLRSWAFAPVRDVLAKGKAMIDWASGFRLATDVPPAEGNR